MKRTLVLMVLGVFALGAVAFLVRPRVLFGEGGGPEVILYSEEGFTGRVLRVTGTLLDMPHEENLDGSLFDWNDRVGSLVVVSGSWRLYQHGRLNTVLDDTPLEELDIAQKRPATGWSVVLSATSQGRLEVPDLAVAGLERDISSIELVSDSTILPDWAFFLRRR